MREAFLVPNCKEVKKKKRREMVLHLQHIRKGRDGQSVIQVVKVIDEDSKLLPESQVNQLTYVFTAAGEVSHRVKV